MKSKTIVNITLNSMNSKTIIKHNSELYEVKHNTIVKHNSELYEV